LDADHTNQPVKPTLPLTDDNAYPGPALVLSDVLEFRPNYDTYRRVSTEDQAKVGDGLRTQAEALWRYRVDHHLPFGIDHEDPGISSATLKRPGLQAALARLKSGESAGLIVTDPDRLTRNVEDMAYLLRSYFLKPGGSILLACSGVVETRTAGGRMQLLIMSVVGQYQREHAAETTVSTMKSKKTNRERTGNIRLGLRLDPDDPRRNKAGRPIGLIVSEADLEVEAAIRRMRAERHSLSHIAGWLNAQGVPTKRGVTGASLGYWTKSSVANVLRKPVP
jgi:DNA invertase Pin-like site-specific DNA recombinase